MNNELNKIRIEILKKFPTQSDFSEAVGEHESRVSQVVRGRRRLSDERRIKWAKVLNCDPAVLMPAAKVHGIETADRLTTEEFIKKEEL